MKKDGYSITFICNPDVVILDEALSYLDDIAHGRKMEYDPHVLKRIVEKGLKRFEELEKAFDSLSKEEEKVMKELSKEIEKNRVLEIIKTILFSRGLCATKLKVLIMNLLCLKSKV